LVEQPFSPPSLFPYHWGFYFILFYYLTEREHRKAERQAEGKGEAGSPLSREPDVGPNPRTPES